MKKRVWVLSLCLSLCMALLPAALAADLASNEFPDFNSAMGYYLDCTDGLFGANYRDNSKSPASYDELLTFAQEYVDLLVDTGLFTVVSTFEDNVYGETRMCFLRYSGTAPMEENLRSEGYLEWLHNGPYHLKISVTEYKRSRWIDVIWDDGLEAVETSLRTPSGERLGRDRPALTVVLGIGYNKMTVGDEAVQVDSQNANVYPIAENGRTLVPIRPIVEAFGGQVDWDSKTNNTTFTLGDRTVSHVIGSRDVTIQAGGQTQKKTMEVPSIAMNDRTYVPVRYVLEGLGLWVGYEPTYQLVVVSTEDLTGENLIKLGQSQLLFASEEVPAVPRKIKESYTTDGGNYVMEVGEALTLFNSYKSSATYYGYSWEVVDGGELVSLDRDGPTCKFYAKRPGVVTFKSHVDETWEGFGSFRNNTRTYTMTITITEATESGSSGGLMKWQTCPTCKGSGTIRSGSKQVTCPTCLGQKQVLLP